MNIGLRLQEMRIGLGYAARAEVRVDFVRRWAHLESKLDNYV